MTHRRIGTLVATSLLMAGLALVPGAADAAVSSTPAATPQLATSGTDGSIEQVRQITQCGGTMYAVGRFTAVENAHSTSPIARNNAFAFSATAPYQVTSWNPDVDGRVDTVACAADGNILLGGAFAQAGGAANRNMAKVDSTTGLSMPWGYHPGGRVAHVEVVAGHALVGGYFPGYLTSVDPATGVPDGYGMPAISGNYQYPGVAGNPTRIWDMSVSPDQTAVLMTGDFTSVGGQHHEQVFRLNLTPRAATVSAWTPTELFTHCATVEPFYAQAATWAPDMSAIYVGATGYKPYNLPSGSYPRSGPCDAAMAYQVGETAFSGHTWINYTGCDSLYAIAANPAPVFVADHERWMSNPDGCDFAGPGAIAQPGLGELNPADGTHQAGPSRGRGLGADDLLLTSAGLWIASDNQANTDSCAGQRGHMGICYLPN
jgi:hypothetical protein